eukprot:c27232_g1_i2 orf=348-644(-)
MQKIHWSHQYKSIAGGYSWQLAREEMLQTCFKFRGCSMMLVPWHIARWMEMWYMHSLVAVLMEKVILGDEAKMWNLEGGAQCNERQQIWTLYSIVRPI